jgi:hypothetical protein
MNMRSEVPEFLMIQSKKTHGMNLLSSAELPTKAPKEEIEKRKKRIE